jgi:WD repeat and SOF domain-containing protein 1
VRFSGDGVYVFSGSEDMNVRIWKAEASTQVGPVRAPLSLGHLLRFADSFACAAAAAREEEGGVRRRAGCALRARPRGQAHCSVRRLSCQHTHDARLPERPRCRHRHVPKAIHKAGALRRTMEDSQRRKRANTIKHSKPGSVELKPARKERLVAELS